MTNGDPDYEILYHKNLMDSMESYLHHSKIRRCREPSIQLWKSIAWNSRNSKTGRNFSQELKIACYALNMHCSSQPSMAVTTVFGPVKQCEYFQKFYRPRSPEITYSQKVFKWHSIHLTNKVRSYPSLLVSNSCEMRAEWLINVTSDRRPCFTWGTNPKFPTKYHSV